MNSWMHKEKSVTKHYTQTIQHENSIYKYKTVVIMNKWQRFLHAMFSCQKQIHCKYVTSDKLPSPHQQHAIRMSFVFRYTYLLAVLTTEGNAKIGSYKKIDK